MNKYIILIVYYAVLLTSINASDRSAYDQLNADMGTYAQNVRKATIDRTLYDQVLALNIQNFLLENSDRLYKMPRSPRVMRSVYENLLNEFTSLRENLLDLQKEANVLLSLDGYLAPLSEPNKETISRLKQKCRQVKHGLACVPLQMNAFTVNLQAVQALSREK